MKNYIIYNDLGQILRIGACLDGDFFYQTGQDEYILEGVADYNTQYIKNKEITNLPIKPEGEYYFDYTTEQWVFNREKAEKDTKQKRDKLLAEGPDRISPMWWSSMTPEEQQAWTEYRQALLDITEQPNYPQEIVWPTKP
jgi:Phage tail assembly chaperone protein